MVGEHHARGSCTIYVMRNGLIPLSRDADEELWPAMRPTCEMQTVTCGAVMVSRCGGNRSVDIHGGYRLAGPEYTKRLAMRAKPRQMRPLPTRLPSQVLGWLSGSQESAGMCVSAEGQPQTSLGVELSEGNQG